MADEGVWLWWVLESGRLYEARFLTDGRRGGWVRRWLVVTDEGDVVDVGKVEAAEFLATKKLP
jgi:hypothetical protein